ncbi:MAG: virulence RhuM family protein [Anaerolineaceae bacterium]|nr:virulence RhuM family protein [Anaerolineaceae bacterium]
MTEHLSDKPTNILIYQAEDGKTHINVRLDDKTVWLTQIGLTELYQTTKQNISLHIHNIFNEGELERDSTVKKYLTVQKEGNRDIKRELEYYNLEVIIAVGYRVRSHRGTQFRRWATERLREYLVKGFTMDDQRLKEGRGLGDDYFDELLERIRDIRASEKQFYRKITEIYRLSADYDSNAEMTREFFATVQNKLHWAITGHTAAELIAERANAEKPNMGLTNWQGKKVRQVDVSVAKNYLEEDELKSLNRIVTMYLDYAEDQAERHQPMYMKDWIKKLDAFLQFNGREVLKDAGRISAEIAKDLAHTEYEKYRIARLKHEINEPDDEFNWIIEQLQKRIEQKQ